MSPFIILLTAAAITATTLSIFFVVKYGGYALSTFPNWPVILLCVVINIFAIAWFTLDFLRRDSLEPLTRVDDATAFYVPVKSTAYGIKFYRYLPFGLFSKKPLAERVLVPVISYKSWQSEISLTSSGMHISVLTHNFIPRDTIRQVTIVKKQPIGEFMTVELHSGGYYRIWLRLVEPEMTLQEIEEVLRDFGYLTRVIYTPDM